MKIYTIRDIAKLAGVGISTVSRVLNNRPDVSEETRRKVMGVVEMYKYTPNANAKNLKQRNADLVSIIVRGRQNSFLNDVAERIIQHGDARGQDFLLDFIDESGDEIAAARRHYTEKKVKGILFLGANIVGRDAEIASLQIPCVFVTIDTSALALPAVSSVSVNNRYSARMAVNYLLQRGHRRIAVFGGIREINDSIGQRYQGVLDCFRAYALSFDETLYVESSFTMEKAYEAAAGFLSASPQFTAVFAMSDVMAIGIMKALADHGLRVPDDISMVGFDGIALSRFVLPTLTTVAQPAEELARHSVALVSRLLADETDTDHVTVESSLLEGASVKTLADSPGYYGA